MPALEMAQETGKLISWLKKEGDSITKGQPLLEIETDKAVMEVEAPADGVLAGIKVQAGAEVPVGQTIAWILSAGETIPTETASVQTGRAITTQSAAGSSVSKAAQSPTHLRDVKISPKARRLASERGVDLSQVTGSGPGGEILASDILACAEKSSATPVPDSPSTVARLMAERTTQSWTTVPHFFLVNEVNAASLIAERDRLAPSVQDSHHTRLTYTDLLVALVGRVLKKHPRVNSSRIGDTVRANAHINVSIAIAVEDGVVAPVIQNADQAPLGQIALQRHELAERARAGKLRPADLSGGTFTISNLGMFGVDAFHAIITPPQVAILAVGRIADRVVALEGKPAVRPMMTLTLSSDHRLIDGARGAAFLRDLSNAIENPAAWLK